MSPFAKTISDILASGRLGKIRAVTVTAFTPHHPKGVADWRPDWRREKRFGVGGVALELGSQVLPLAFDWLGGQPTSVTAKTVNRNPDRFETEDSFSAVYTFPEGTFDVHFNWSAGTNKELYSIQGEQGAITIVDDDMQVSYLQPGSTQNSDDNVPIWNSERRLVPNPWKMGDRATWFNPLFDGFRVAIEKGDYATREAEGACRSTCLTQIAYRSAADQCRETKI